MPIYEIKNLETDEIFEVMLSISDYEKLMKENPNYQRYFSNALLIGDSLRLGVSGKKPPNWITEKINSIKRNTPGHQINNKFGNNITEI